MSSLLQQIKSLDINKQSKLTAGNNISIDEFNVISSLGDTTTTTSSTDTSDLQAQIDANRADIDANSLSLNGKQNTILDGDLSISKTLNLQSTLDGKQNELTAGENISIVDNVISSTGASKLDIGFLAYHNTTTIYNSVQILPYNLVKYNTGAGYNPTTSIFTCPVSGKYYFYATYNTVSGSRGVVDLIRQKPGGVEEILGRGQEGQVNPADKEKRIMNVVIDCELGDTLFAKIPFNSVRLSPEDYLESEDIVYSPFGCQLIPTNTDASNSNTIGFLAYHNTSTDYSAVQKLPYNLIKYNTGSYDNTTYTFTAPVAGKYYFYATYFTLSGNSAEVDLILKKVGGVEQTIARSQEGTATVGTHEKREISVVIDCDLNDELYALVQSSTIRLAPGFTSDSSNDIIYGPYGCQLLT